MTDTSSPNDIDDLNADLARRLGSDRVETRAPSDHRPPAAPPGTDPPAWLPIAAAALLCLALGLGAGWLLFGRGNTDVPAAERIEASTNGDEADASEPAEQRDNDQSQAQPDDTLTLEDLFEQLPFEQVAPGESPLDGTPFGELPLDDFMSPDDLEQLEQLLDNMPSTEQLNELFGSFDEQNLDDLLDPERVDEMNQLLEELFGS